jgi:hypothetical protein
MGDVDARVHHGHVDARPVQPVPSERVDVEQPCDVVGGAEPRSAAQRPPVSTTGSETTTTSGRLRVAATRVGRS